MKTKQLQSTLWIFLTANYLFCDVFSIYNSVFLNQLLTGEVDGIQFNEEFLLKFAIIMEIPMLMIVLSTVLKNRLNKILTITVAVLMLVVQFGSLVTGDNMLHYIFFSVVEICTLVAIIGVTAANKPL
ncbi:DUF6326 family protein [Maribacter hydrothermalis]|uniref:Uncharacterized protein n=1 Tax=Maribacter hydrothermalis TaxID=1836467 RepID=A0A1B7ZCH4_9FLAO|nr:DUF6326 family protein [Maribacter hydrothermalis]APQ18625.1 hypothetical protein BTR34_15435 [Maribacter hydrothermalis]OBR40819.1 hypothetical protein A9200_14615 [Maribacter hydrothermalis]